MIQFKPTSTLLFAVLLTDWVHFTSSQPPLSPQDPYIQFVHRLEQALDTSSPDALPFWLQGHVIENLVWTSDEFKRVCRCYVSEHFLNFTHTPIMTLYDTINHVFRYYTRSTKNDSHLLAMLQKVKSMDPIGFDVYLTQKNIPLSRKNPSQRSIQGVIDFEATTGQRIRLFNMRTNDSCFDIFDETNSETPYNIPLTARNEIATEYGPLSDVSIDQFTNLSKQMYRVGTDNLDEYQEHFSKKLSDVQIVYDINSRQTSHAICISYKAVSCMVHVYDSLMRKKVDDRQDAIIKKLYPFNNGIIFKKPKTRQNPQYPTGAIFAITYASILLLDKDPTKTPIKLNTVFGDEALHMRIHILNMLANRELALSK